MELTFEEWRHTYADVFETDDAARTAWIVASNRGYRVGVSDTRALLAAHSAGAQEPVAWQFRERGTDHWVACPEKPTHLSDRDFEKRPLYDHPQPITNAARDVLIERARRLLEGATWNLGGVLCSESKASDIPSRASSAVKSRHLASLRDALAEIERLDRAKGE